MKRIEISGSLITTSALHIGAGWDAIRDVELSPTQQARRETADAGFAAVQLDCNQAPCIPGSTLKGVLRARALRIGIDDAIVTRVFGGSDSANPSIGGVQFLVGRWAGYPFAPKCDEAGTYGKNTLTLPLARHARDRKTKAVENKKLFTKDVVADGAKFDIRLRITRDNVTEEDITILLGLLNAFDGTTEGITLGAGSGSGLGAAKWSLSQVTTLQQTNSQDLWDALLKGQFVLKRTALAATQLSTPKECIAVDLAIPIDGPFLSHGGVKKENGIESFVPRRTRSGEPVFSGASLRGALRSQAERICRTVGLEVDDAAHPFEPLHVLFGSEKRKGGLRFSDFVAAGGSEFSQEFVAIDRFTGGAADGLKFKGKSVLDPTLKGQLIIDLKALKATSAQADSPVDFTDAALGLLLLVLRDLDDGDVPLGFGAAAKGYGQVSAACSATTAVRTALCSITRDPEYAVLAIQEHFSAVEKWASTIPVKSVENVCPPLLKRGKDNEQNLFHPPYTFIPLSSPGKKPPDSWISVAQCLVEGHEKLHHWHSRYAVTTADGLQPVYSGQISCELTTLTPLVIGAAQHAAGDSSGTNKIEQFQIRGNPAIPATSLRGLFSGLVEATTQSAMRVLSDGEALSVRMTTDQALPRVGVVVQGDGCLKVSELGKISDEWAISEGAASTLHRLADLAARASDKAHPEIKRAEGGRQLFDWQTGGAAPRLAVGQKVFFRERSGTKEVAEIAWSQIWRKSVSANGKNFCGRDFVANIDPELVPFSSVRKLISPAEWMFGFAAQERLTPSSSTSAERSLTSFAGKLRFSMATSITPITLVGPPIRLKILASPKPPSPSMYMHPKLMPPGGKSKFVSKVDLASNPGNYHANGYKTYPPHARQRFTPATPLGAATRKLDISGNFAAEYDSKANFPWQSTTAENDENNNQRASVTPIPEGSTFNFSISFDNLSQHELEILAFAIAPHTQYVHRLGMGKPIGLGTVKIRPTKMEICNRLARYCSDEISTARAHMTWTPAKAESTRDICSVIDSLAAAARRKLTHLGDGRESPIGTAIWNAIAYSGHPEAPCHPTITPARADQRNAELETYAWFVKNETSAQGAQFMQTPNPEQPLPVFFKN